MGEYNVLNDLNSNEVNLLIPVQSFQEVNPIFKYVTNRVTISVDLKDKEIYLEKSAGANMYALTHKALMKLSTAANGQIVSINKVMARTCVKCIEIVKATKVVQKCAACPAQYNVAAEVIMKFPELSGGWRIVQASREIDLSTVAKAGQADKMKEFAGEHAESKAMSRCIRKALSIKSAYTLEELKKPFVAVYPVLDAKDPDVKKALIAGSMTASNLLYGSGLQIGPPEKLEALPEGKTELLSTSGTVITADDYEVEKFEEGQPDEQENASGNPGKQSETPSDKLYCSNQECKAEIAENVAKFSQEKYGKELCFKCQQIEKKKQKEVGK